MLLKKIIPNIYSKCKLYNLSARSSLLVNNAMKAPQPSILNENFDYYSNWKEWEEIEQEGIIVGCDWRIQTMIPWWWEQYNRHNSLPVTFIDMGLSAEMLRFCKSKGKVVPLHVPKYLLKKRIPLPGEFSQKLKKKGAEYKKLERLSFFLKPLALMQTPYEKTLWLDFDCHVRAPLSSVFSYCDEHIAMTPMSPHKQKHPVQKTENSKDKILYNCGVICYKRGDGLIRQWARETLFGDAYYYADQDILNELVYKKKIPVKRLPNTYNWIVKEWGLNPEAKVIHYAGLKKWFDHNSFSRFKIQLPESPFHW